MDRYELYEAIRQAERAGDAAEVVKLVRQVLIEKIVADDGEELRDTMEGEELAEILECILEA